MSPQPHKFPVDEIRELARELYGLDAGVGVLPSYYDQNFQLDDTASGRRLVLKVAHAAEERSQLDLQNRTLEHVGRAGLSFEIPRVCPTLEGEDIATVSRREGTRHFVRLLTWVEGTPWLYKGAPTSELLGAWAARLAN